MMIRGAIAVLFQTLLTAGSLFLLYGVLVKVLGPELLGVWAVVMAATSVTRIAEFGLGGGVVKFVARYNAQGAPQLAAAAVQTAVVSVGCIVLVILPGVYWLMHWVLGKLLSGSLHLEAVAILPLSLCSLWLTSVGSVFLSALDANQRFDLRATVTVGGQLVFVGAALVVVRDHGIVGLAYCQIVQATLMLVSGWIVLRSHMKGLPPVPWRWNRRVFSEMFTYSTSFQAVGLAQLLFDPISKLLLSKFGSISAVAYFEMASRMVVQVRSLLVSASQVLVPTVATVVEHEPRALAGLYTRCLGLMAVLAAALFGAVAIGIPAISRLWIGRDEPLFVTFAYLLTFAWWLNALTAPAYQMYLGIGDLRWNLLSHVAMGALNFLLGVVLGRLFGAEGVAAATCLALVGASVIPVYAFHRDSGIGWHGVVDDVTLRIYVGCATLIVASILLANADVIQWPPLYVAVVGLVLLALLFATVARRHPEIKYLMGRLELTLKGRVDDPQRRLK